MKIYKISQAIINHDPIDKESPSYDNDEYERATQYFGIGHGDFNEDVGYEPKFTIWIFDGERIQWEDVSNFNEETGQFEDDSTHAILWGKYNVDNLYKGRYEPQTGELSIVRPNRNRFRPVPEVVIKSLKNTFDNIQNIHIF
jgi:hypothetical protein